MPNTSVVPCLACGVHTGNAHLVCSDACFEEYARMNQDIVDAEVMWDMMGDWDTITPAGHVDGYDIPW